MGWPGSVVGVRWAPGPPLVMAEGRCAASEVEVCVSGLDGFEAVFVGGVVVAVSGVRGGTRAVGPANRVPDRVPYREDPVGPSGPTGSRTRLGPGWDPGTRLASSASLKGFTEECKFAWPRWLSMTT